MSYYVNSDIFVEPKLPVGTLSTNLESIIMPKVLFTQHCFWGENSKL